MKNYQSIPNIISNIDLNHLGNIYDSNFNACKLANSFIKKVNDLKVKELLIKTSEIHKEHCKAIINILE